MKKKLAKIEKEFKRLKKQEDYPSLGWFFWGAFVTLEKGTPERETFSRLWDSLTKREKKLCEQV